ncbi:MAG: hypothetical protein JNL01_05030 [Bdellovibrionales bacterium]|nr:hypothetical protein [Bdellovibrionales bacterium]
MITWNSFRLAAVGVFASFIFALQAQAGGCEVTDVTGFPNDLSALKFNPKKKGKVYDPEKTVILFPSTANMTVLDKIQAARLCGIGVRVLVLKDWKFDQVELSRLDYFNVILQNGIVFADAVMGRYKGTFGVMGSSLGGVVASVVKGIRPKIGPAVLLVAGAGLPELLAYTVSAQWVKVQEAQMAALGTTDRAVLQAELAKVIVYEPAQVADPSQSKMIRFVGGDQDKKVFTKNQYQLWEAWGKPQYLFFNFGHVTSIVLSELFFSGSHARFLKRRL